MDHEFILIQHPAFTTASTDHATCYAFSITFVHPEIRVALIRGNCGIFRSGVQLHGCSPGHVVLTANIECLYVAISLSSQVHELMIWIYSPSMALV
jgi:hypothetical protein